MVHLFATHYQQASKRNNRHIALIRSVTFPQICTSNPTSYTPKFGEHLTRNKTLQKLLQITCNLVLRWSLPSPSLHLLPSLSQWCCVLRWGHTSMRTRTGRRRWHSVPCTPCSNCHVAARRRTAGCNEQDIIAHSYICITRCKTLHFITDRIKNYHCNDMSSQMLMKQQLSA